MSIQTRKIVALMSATALLGGVGLGVADAAKSTQSAKTSRQAGPGGKRGGPIPAAALQKIATALGVSTADLRAALDANRPAQPTAGDQHGPQQFASDLATALGVDTSAVQTILDANRPAKPATPPAKGTMPAKPDRSKLVAALASGLNLDQATVQSALAKLDAARQADHQARETAMYAAVAKALGKTTDQVKAAFEANRPAPPTA